MTLNAVFFDLDGTLLDTAPNMAKALNGLLKELGRPAVAVDEVRSLVSDGAYALLKYGLGLERGDAETEDMRTRMLDYYLEDLASGTTAYPGIDALIETLTGRGIQWGIVTNKPSAYAEPLMEHFRFASPPVCLLCPDHVSQRKPHPEPLHKACALAGCGQNSAIYVGDHLRDIQCGQNANMTTIAVSYGYLGEHDQIEAWGADHVAASAHDIWPLVQRYV